MIVGSAGSGKTYVAKYIAQQLLSVHEADENPYVKILAPETSSVTIEQIRELQKFLSLKVPGAQPIRRVCMIEQAETMTHEAQNALLKILEEPPTDTVILLLADTPQALLQTIQSRTQKIELLPLEKSQLLSIADRVDTNNAERAALLSAGRPGLFTALLRDEDHPLSLQIAQAKKFLTASHFDRLVMMQSYKEKPEIATFLQALLITANAALKVAIAKHKIKEVKSWHARCKVIFELQQKLELNVSTRLLLTSLALDV